MVEKAAPPQWCSPIAALAMLTLGDFPSASPSPQSRWRRWCKHAPGGAHHPQVVPNTHTHCLVLQIESSAEWTYSLVWVLAAFQAKLPTAGAPFRIACEEHHSSDQAADKTAGDKTQRAGRVGPKCGGGTRKPPSAPCSEKHGGSPRFERHRSISCCGVCGS